CAYLMPQGYRIHSPTVRRTAPTSPNQVQYGRPTEAIAAFPSTAEQRAAYEQLERAWKPAEPHDLAEALAQIEWDEEYED
ncbi:hypothetical protein, partial [Kitasatospora sp. NPDC050463]|uniref:hypothetical protein n=1 Tax=Kitasatospora sp. NPDC050463 TaxID=3155786 RepID=UPI0033DB9BF1